MASEPLKQLTAACLAGDAAGVERLIPAVTASEVRKSGYGCFVEACLAGHTAIAASLVASFNITAGAVCDPEFDIFGAICQHGAHPNVTDWAVYKFGLGPGSAAARRAARRAFRAVCAAGRLPVARWLAELFELTADDARDDDCWVLRHACINGHIPLASWLVTKFNLNNLTNQNQTGSLLSSVPGGSPSTSAVPDGSPSTSAVPDGIVKGADARALRNFALRWACIRGRLDAARWLAATFELGAADARDDDNYALRHCCFRGQLASVRWLVEHFGLTAGDVGARDGEALRWARENGHGEVVQYLLSVPQNEHTPNLTSDRPKPSR